MPRCYVWNQAKLLWTRRKKKMSWPAIGRMYACHAGSGERYYLRRLLHYSLGAKSFDDLYKFDGKTFEADACETLQEVCARMGLLEDDRDWVTCLEEAALFQSAASLR